MVWLNDHLPAPTVSRGPWGAAAGGGLGRTLGQAGLRACAQEKLITWDPPAMRGVWWGPYDGTSVKAMRAVAKLRSGRESDRERAWREGAVALARVGARAFGRGLPNRLARSLATPCRGDAEPFAVRAPERCVFVTLSRFARLGAVHICPFAVAVWHWY